MLPDPTGPLGPISEGELAPLGIDGGSRDFRVLAVQIRDAGLLDRRPGYYSVKIVLTIAAFAAGWAALADRGQLVGHARCRSVPRRDVHPAGLRRP